MRTAALLLLLASYTANATILICQAPNTIEFETTRDKQCPDGTMATGAMADSEICNAMRRVRDDKKNKLDSNYDEPWLLTKLRNAQREMTKYNCRI